MRRLKERDGSVYIFVLVVSLSVFIMLSAAIGATRYEAAVSHAYASNASLYYLAESGVYKAIDVLDKLAVLSEEEITMNADEYIRLHAGIYSTGLYFDFMKYRIETVNRQSVNMTYDISIIIKAEFDGTYAIISEASNGDAFVKVYGAAGLVYDIESHVKLSLIKQLME